MTAEQCLRIPPAVLSCDFQMPWRETVTIEPDVRVDVLDYFSNLKRHVKPGSKNRSSVSLCLVDLVIKTECNVVL